MGVVWTVKGGRHGEREERLLEHGLIGGGWERLPLLEGVTSKQDLAALYVEHLPEASDKRMANHVAQLWSLRDRMKVNELVVMPLKTTGTIAVGRISGDYEYRQDLGDDLRHCRPVRWLATDVARDAFDQDLLYSFGAFLTFAQVRRDSAEERVLAAMQGRRRPPSIRLPGDADTEELEQTPNVEALAREQVRQYISQRFVGHDLAALVAVVLKAQGFTAPSVSPPGADRGVDILAGSGPMGLGSPRLAVQVKSGQAGVDEFRALRGVVEDFRADQGLLVAWGGFKGRVRTEARQAFFTIRLWDAEELLDELFSVYEQLPDDLRSELPLQRVWALVPSEE